MLWPFQLLRSVREMLVLIREIVVLQLAILKALRFKKPGLVFLKVLSEEGDMLNFVLNLPAPGAADVVNRKLVVKIGDADAVEVELAGDALVSDSYAGEQDAAVSGTLVDVDDAGNASEPSEFAFTLADTIAPPKPGDIGLTVTAES